MHLPCIKMVMVGTTLPANIGATARAMATMAVEDLVLVEPKYPIDHTSYQMAAGGAHILDTAHTFDTLEMAVSQCNLIIGLSARTRRTPKITLTPQDLGGFLQGRAGQCVAFVLGREDRGLTNDELNLCDAHLCIPANPNYPVLNVASAAQVLLSHLYALRTLPSSGEMVHTVRSQWDAPPLDTAQKMALEATFLDLMTQLELPQQDELRRILRLIQRVQLDRREGALLLAVLHKILKKVQL